MKKTLALLLLALLLCGGCANGIASQGGVVSRGASPTEPPASQIVLPENTAVVYVTRTGQKYHEPDCPLLGGTAFPVTLEQALEDGFTPCSRCH